VGTIRRIRGHPRRQEDSVFRIRDCRLRPLQTKNQLAALHRIPAVTRVFEIDSPSKRPTASVPLRPPPPPTLHSSQPLLTTVIPYEGAARRTVHGYRSINGGLFPRPRPRPCPIRYRVNYDSLRRRRMRECMPLSPLRGCSITRWRPRRKLVSLGHPEDGRWVIDGLNGAPRRTLLCGGICQASASIRCGTSFVAVD
jgi:hypothetical protein